MAKNNTVVLNDGETWDKWRAACEEADKDSLDDLFAGLEEADGVKSQIKTEAVPNVVDPWSDSGLSESEWNAQQAADADTWEA